MAVELIPREIQEKYDGVKDHDLIILQIAKMESMCDKLSDFVQTKKELCVKHEARMGKAEDRLDGQDGRISILETYFKVLVGAAVLSLGTFGVYFLDKIIGGG
jgi:hypothetical protein